MLHSLVRRETADALSKGRVVHYAISVADVVSDESPAFAFQGSMQRKSATEVTFMVGLTSFGCTLQCVQPRFGSGSRAFLLAFSKVTLYPKDTLQTLATFSLRVKEGAIDACRATIGSSKAVRVLMRAPSVAIIPKNDEKFP